MSDKLYNQLKFVAQVGLPALGTLYFTLAGIWGLPAAEQVVGTIVAVDTFLGVLLHISTRKYNDSLDDDRHGRVQGGVIRITEVGDKQVFSLELDGDPVVFKDNKEVVFKVNLTKAGDE